MVQEIDERLAALRDRLRERYGWTHLDVRVTLERERLRVTGTVAVPSLAARVRELLSPYLRPDLQLELRLGPMPVLGWHSIPATVELWAEHPSLDRRSLATELLPDDGPLGLLAEAPPGILVRARDGTVGWLREQLGPPAPARPLTGPMVPEQPGATLCAAAIAYLGVPYRLGGSSFAAIDCSGLIARSYAALDVVLPRNSNDQRAIGGGGEPIDPDHAEIQAGDLLFMRSRSLGRSHVGLATGRGTVIHASRSRNGAEFGDLQHLKLVRLDHVTSVLAPQSTIACRSVSKSRFHGAP